MYRPKSFIQVDEQKIKQIINDYPFATILSTQTDGEIFINHLPLMMSPTEVDVLIGHMAKNNPQWKHFEANPHAIVIFQGPHTYISPRWYKSGRDVPTWNYAVVHLKVRVDLLPGFDDQVNVLKLMSEYFEKDVTNPWGFHLPDDLREAVQLSNAVMSFKFHIEEVEAKFKLSQNRTVEDQTGVIEGLEYERTDDLSLDVAKLMSETLKG